MNLSEARSMLAAARVSSESSNHALPAADGFEARSLFRKAPAGSVLLAESSHFSLRALNAQWADPSAPAHWRQRSELSGNNILSVGIYGEVLGRFLGDPSFPLCAGRRIYSGPARLCIRIPDCLQVLGEWPDQVLGTLQWSGVALHGGNEQIEIFGSEGTLVYDFSTDEIFLGRPSDAGMAPLTIPREFKREWTVEQDFIRAVREGGYPEPSFHTGVRYMEFVEAIQHSMAQSAWIRLSEL